MRESFVHARRVEIPDRRPAHDEQPQGAENAKVDGGVELFHEPTHLPLLAYPQPNGQGTNEALHEKLAGEGEDDGVEGDEGEVLRALAVLRDMADVRGERASAFVERRVGVGEEEGGMERVVFAGGDEVEGEDDEDEDERGEPGVLQCDPLPAAEESLRLLAFAASFFPLVLL